ncbi:hypothetical protein D3C83_274970 [compost metagenome]
MGPPMTKRPVGLMKYLVFLWIQSAGSTLSMISSRTAACRSFCEISGACWVESTMASICTGLPFS